MSAGTTWADVALQVINNPTPQAILIIIVIAIIVVLVVYAVKSKRFKLEWLSFWKKKETKCIPTCTTPRLASWLTTMSIKTEQRIANQQHDLIDDNRGRFLRYFKPKLMNEYDLEIFWRNVATTLAHIARHNHILENVRGSTVDLAYLETKMHRIRRHYDEDRERFESLPEWETLREPLGAFLIGVLIQFAEVAEVERKDAAAGNKVLTEALAGIPALKSVLADLPQ